MTQLPAHKSFLTPEDAQRIDGIVFLALVPIEMELCAMTPEACAKILYQLRKEGRTVSGHSRYGLPQWMASLPERDSMKYYYGPRNGQIDHRTVPRDVLVDEAWHWAPLQPGPDLYATLCHRTGINPDPDYYYQGRQDRRSEISGSQFSRLEALVKHFTTGVDLSAFYESYHVNHPGASLCAGATFTRAFRQFLGGTVVPPRADASTAFLTAYSVVTGMPISDELAQAGIDALGEMSAQDRDRLVNGLQGNPS